MTPAARKRSVTIVLALALLGWVGWSAWALAQARSARDQARVAASAAVTVPASGGSFAAADAPSARASLAAWLGDRAVATGVRLSLASLASGLPGQIRIRLVARADEAALRRFLHAADAPAVLHAGRWTLAPDPGGGLRLSADVAAAWNPAGTRRLTVTPLPPSETGRALFAEAAASDIAPSAGDSPELIGIAGRIPDGAVAMLRLADGATRVVARGGSADGWQITAIAADRITLTKSGRSHVAILPPTSR